MLSGEADANDAYVEIHAGAGGTESQDWAQMLERMYVRWAEGRDYKVEIIGEHYGEEAGIKSATVLIKGANAYGWLKTEVGRSPPGANLTLRFQCPPAHEFCLGFGLSRSRRYHRGRYRREGRAHRYLSFLGRGRSARQHHRQRRAPHPSAHRHRGAVPERAVAAQEPGHGLGDAARAPLRGRAEAPRRGGASRRRRQVRHRLRPPDPVLRAPALPAGEGSAHRRGKHQSHPPCSTARSIASSRRRWPSASTPTRTSDRLLPGVSGRKLRSAIRRRGAGSQRSRPEASN